MTGLSLGTFAAATLSFLFWGWSPCPSDMFRKRTCFLLILIRLATTSSSRFCSRKFFWFSRRFLLVLSILFVMFGFQELLNCLESFWGAKLYNFKENWGWKDAVANGVERCFEDLFNNTWQNKDKIRFVWELFPIGHFMLIAVKWRCRAWKNI